SRGARGAARGDGSRARPGERRLVRAERARRPLVPPAGSRRQPAAHGCRRARGGDVAARALFGRSAAGRLATVGRTRGQGGTMTTLENRPNTALLVVDVQTGVVAGNHERDSVVANVGSLVEKARGEGIPVVWVQHNDQGLARGSEEWQIVSELSPGEGEPLVEKSYGDSFEDTNLESVLSELGVGRLVVAGAQTDACIRSTLHGALARGYDATLVSDAHTTEDLSAWGAPPPDAVIAHTNLYWGNQAAPHCRAVQVAVVEPGRPTALHAAGVRMGLRPEPRPPARPQAESVAHSAV